ncbi:MAG: mevalonate-3-kinase [Thermoplasmata archaeon]
MAEHFVKAISYPTIGIVLLGGISNKKTRTPRHTSAGIAYTNLDNNIKTETSLYEDTETHVRINGKESDDASRSVMGSIEAYRNRILNRWGCKNISIDSTNYGILSGSSDSGAAALGKAVESSIDSDIDLHDIENNMRAVSESVGRSLFGGLTITWSDGYFAYTERILDESAFRDFLILGFSFDYKRNPSDVIHENIVKNENYSKRIRKAEERAHKIKELSRYSDIEGIFDIAEADTDDYHEILRDSGVNVIKENMGSLIEQLKQVRKVIWNRYIVTGGSNVYAVVKKYDYQQLLPFASKFGSTVSVLKVAGPALTVQKDTL